MDYNLAKFEIPISITKAFNKGKIAESYKEIYRLANELASGEALTYQSQKHLEYFDSKLKRVGSPDKSSIDILGQTESYKNKRMEYHLQNMIHLLEIYATQPEK